MKYFVHAWVQELTDDEFDQVVARLHLEVDKLSDFRQAVYEVPQTNIMVFYQTGKTEW